MRSMKTCLAAAVLTAISISAHAAVDTISITSGQFTPIQPPNTVTFDSAIPSDIYYSSLELVQGSVVGEYVTPQYDTTQYLRTVNTPTVITFAGAGATYFGFYLGSSDIENTVTAYGSDGSVTSWNGADLLALTTNGAFQDSFYVNLWSTTGTAFTSIVLSSLVTPMETDNHAYILAVPEPSTYAMMLGGLLLMGAATQRRRR